MSLAADTAATLLGERAESGREKSKEMLEGLIGNGHDEDFQTDYLDKIKSREQDINIFVEKIGKPLSATDVVKCDYKIRQMHPLYDTPLSKTFPTLCCCMSSEKK